MKLEDGSLRTETPVPIALRCDDGVNCGERRALSKLIQPSNPSAAARECRTEAIVITMDSDFSKVPIPQVWRVGALHVTEENRTRTSAIVT